MASDKRLHPASFVFVLGSQARELLLPGVAAVLFTSRSGEWGWQAVAMVLFIPYTLVAIGRALSYRYRLDDDELVIRSGVLSRSVRHLPYTRIHNIDAVQNVLHRMLGVAAVRIETGGGGEPEASIQVLSLEAFQELRRHVLARRRPAGVEEAPEEAPLDADVVLRLSPREIMLSGFIHNRAAIVIGAGLGLLWEFGIAESLMEGVFGQDIPGRGIARELMMALAGQGEMPILTVIYGLLGLLVILLLLRVISMFWALVTLNGYTLVQQKEDLRAEFGLLTRITATTPLKRIQTLTVRHGPTHRAFDRVSVRVQTAGDVAATGEQASRREALAPILPSGDVQPLIDRVLPGTDLSQVEWQPSHPRGVRRAFVVNAVFGIALTCWLILFIGWWWFAMLPLILGWAFGYARMYVRHLGWGTAGGAVFFRSGWLWRNLTIVRFARVQAVSMAESPFDRRHGMARVFVDTFGASAASHSVDIPYVPREAAVGLVTLLATEAAKTGFRL